MGEPLSKGEDKQTVMYKVKKEEVKEAQVVATLYYWYCPLCNKILSNFSRDKLLASIKLHLTRAHGVKTVVFE
ncbi:MAG: hypothetical protein LM558_00065 [Thermosphaera sp.]|nr:hypothetical protein [Thermosphaera sp.]